MTTHCRQYEYPQSKIARRWSYKSKTDSGVFDPDLCILFIFQARLRRLSALSGYKGCSDVEQIQQIQKTLESTDYISSEESVDEDIGSDSSDSEARSASLRDHCPGAVRFLTSISMLLTSVPNASKKIRDMVAHKATKGVLEI